MLWSLQSTILISRSVSDHTFERNAEDNAVCAEDNDVVCAEDSDVVCAEDSDVVSAEDNAVWARK
jgi:hypothetical protein